MPYPPPQGAKRNTIGVNRRSKCQVATLYGSYVSLSNEMPFVHHVVDANGGDAIIKA